MKKFNIKALFIFAMAAVMFSGCASIKTMKKNADQLGWKVTPEVLEAHAGLVEMAIEGQVPEKYFVKKATIEATPVLKYADGMEKAYPTVKLQGEKVTANNAVVSFDAGGNFSMKGSIPYEDAMKVSELEVRIVASKGAASLDFDPIKIADGVIATSELVIPNGAPIVGISKGKNNSGKYDPAIDKFQRIVPDEFVADIHYLINSSYVLGKELKSEDVEKFGEYTKDAFDAERKDLKGIEVSAYASPDGEQDWNTTLSQRRESSSAKYVEKAMKKLKVDAEVNSKYTAEDWEGFKELMENSSIQDKELILRVLSMYSDPETREKEIRNLSEAFTAVAEDILPQLRRAKLTASVDLIGKTDDEILALADENPSELNQAELIYAASLTEDMNKQLEYYNAFTKAFSDDWRGFNNVGATYVKMGEFEKAAKNFEKADKLDSDNAIIQNNLGVIALKNGETEKARELFSAASGSGKQVDHNMGIVSIIRGEYDKAVKYFGSECVSPNAALAQILAGDNNGALKTLDANTNDKCFMVDYLKAVVGARTAKTNLLFENLKSATEKNADLKAAAKTDLEFAKYFADPKFKEIVD